MTGGWTVYTSWLAYRTVPATETRETFPDWSAARRQALRNACCAGVRYVSAQGPGDVVAGEYDRYTNRWREYGPFLAARAALSRTDTEETT